MSTFLQEFEGQFGRRIIFSKLFPLTLTITSQLRNWCFPTGENIWGENRSLTASSGVYHMSQLLPESSQLLGKKLVSEVNSP